jgi:hypothetical protein
MMLYAHTLNLRKFNNEPLEANILAYHPRQETDL